MMELTRHQKHQTAIKALRTGGRWTPVNESNAAISPLRLGSDDVRVHNVFFMCVVVFVVAACFL